MADSYLGALSVVEGLGRSFGFDAIFYWQPMLATTDKELTAYERSAREEGRWGDAVRECTRQVGLEADRRGVGSYEQLTALFDDWVEAVFIDDYGHVTETANRRIAEAMLERLLPLVTEAR